MGISYGINYGGRYSPVFCTLKWNSISRALVNNMNYILCLEYNIKKKRRDIRIKLIICEKINMRDLIIPSYEHLTI